MFIASIVCIGLEITLYLVLGLNYAFDPTYNSVQFSLAVIIFACTVVCISGAITSVSGIKDRKTRSKAIATAAVSIAGSVIGLIFSIQAFFMVLVPFFTQQA